MGVPTVGGETNFHRAYNGNILVNAMTLGLADADRIFYSAAAGVGNPVVYVGSKTGRDGIKGAVMASDVFTEDSQSRRPTVQVGDPFTEKLLLEACLELMATDAIVAIQDMGAAGLTSSAIEMAAKGGLGIAIDLDLAPQREAGMSAYEIMLSESQERMVIILKPGREDIAAAIFKKWELDFAVIGHLTDNGRLVLTRHGKVEADLPVLPLVDEAPRYDRPIEATPAAADVNPADYPLPAPPLEILRRLVGCPDLASKRWIYEQYDSLVRGDTAAGPGEADAAIVRLPDSNRAIAITTDCTPRYVLADPKMGGMQAIVEAWRNLTATGALPIAVTDNMNFGSPEKPRIMGQFAHAIAGMAEACVALDFPVVSGNVSLYNETSGDPVLPTPAIGAVGLIDDIDRTARIALPGPRLAILLVGDTPGHLGQSLYLREIHGAEAGPPPPVDLAVERRNGDFVRGLIQDGLVLACHDVSDGGLLVALAEMAMAGNIGANLINPSPLGGEGGTRPKGGRVRGRERSEPLAPTAPEAPRPPPVPRGGGEGL
jgi:phosphoribosylformylglycinamidine synthase